MSKKKKKSFNEFVTLPKSNAGVDVKIPNTNGETLTILGVHSDIFRKKSIELFEGVKVFKDNEELTDKETNDIARKNRLELLCACIVGWSFSDNFTPENVKKMLVNAPHIANFIDREIDNQSNFLGKL